MIINLENTFRSDYTNINDDVYNADDNDVHDDGEDQNNFLAPSFV